ncbi:MAG: MFS transporter [Rhizobiales bacterium]|nr:MFS transporter [Hyphomicrobiales bacterium]MBO6699956.1 MFS transporter [Hyphomicrobiales bacterium]MBO6737879.1 MFS transporter [Hyphomicrobiales bacterium]MBO6913064.1 MFS transporter [Hyphomicrobiales bacterium]MBO6956652.1 MFS transporter [Hyphomicrobiales bacterium]
MTDLVSTQSQTPFVRRSLIVLIAGSMIAMVAVGMRHSFGLFLDPVTRELQSIDREAFGLAVALQNLMWGLAQPFAGMIADRFGTFRVVFAGGALYALGLLSAALSSSALGLTIGLGVLVGMGLSATTYAVVLGAVGRHYPPEKRSTALGIASLGGSIGIFLSVPLTLSLIEQFGWSAAFLGLAMIALVICLLAPPLAGRPETTGPEQSMGSAINQALRHRGFVLLLFGFFVCGFQLAFIGIHLPAYLLDRDMDVWLGGAALAMIGATNIIGTLVCGALGDRFSKKNLLALLYLVRAVVVAVFVLLPPSAITTLLFAALIGFTWLGTVPLTSGIVAQVFGPRYLATLVGIVFLMHQLGSFLGAWMGGYAFERWGSYDLVWWTVVLLGLLATLLHWPINEEPLRSNSLIGECSE